MSKNYVRSKMLIYTFPSDPALIPKTIKIDDDIDILSINVFGAFSVIVDGDAIAKMPGDAWFLSNPPRGRVSLKITFIDQKKMM